MTTALKMMMARSTAAAAQTYVDDVFDIRIYNGTGAARSFVTGVDLSGHAGMVWTKRRNTTENHCIFDTVRGVNNVLVTHSTAASAALANSVTAFNNNGFSTSSAVGVNSNTGLYAAWTFREASNFFKLRTVSHTNGTATTVDLSSLGTVGMVWLKITSTTGAWNVWHKDLTSGSNLVLNTTAAEAAGGLSVSGTTLTIASTLATGTYMLYAWADDASATGMVRCGTYLGTGARKFVSCGWEPQFILIKRKNAAANWVVFDHLRGMPALGNDCPLVPNATTAETVSTNIIEAASEGFYVQTTDATVSASGGSFVWMAIRRPNKPPTSGSEVFNPTVYTGTNAANRFLDLGIQADMAWLRRRAGSGGGYEGFLVGHRTRGQGWVKTQVGGPVETVTAAGLDQQLATSEWGNAFTSNSGIYIGNANGTTNTTPNLNSIATANSYVGLGFRRRVSVFDSLTYIGDGTSNRAIKHSLGVAPELLIIKSQTSTDNWLVWHKDFISASYQMYLDTNGSPEGPYNDLMGTLPTASQFLVNSTNIVNGSALSYMAMLFATKAGVSKVGSYVGNGSSQTIDCGFSGPARFIMIGNGGWRVFDSARGIATGVDPLLWTSKTDAESSATDEVDPVASGFIVKNAVTGGNNVNGTTYYYLAFS